ncbi:MAG: pirin family protein [Klebsiella grimontii]|nr:pirin family protein [Klebsiella grimontii]
MIYLRKANERGHANHGWLDSWHTFSFANYYDPNFMGFSALRVINDDVIDAGQGFGTHPHKDMEILTYVLEGAVEHQDSMGNKEQVPAGEFQIMSAGTGVRHSEYNPSATEKLHLYQIWIMPEKNGITPRYEQRRFDAAQGNGTKATTSDGLAIWDEQAISVHADSDSEILLFDLPPV